MEDKKFYWIKLRTDFFNANEIDFLLTQKNGCEYVVLYQMLCIKTANTGGNLYTQIGETLIPYDTNKIVRETKYFTFDTVVIALELFKKLGLVYEQENQILKIVAVDNMVGRETGSAQRVREHRAKKVLQCNKNATPNVTPKMLQCNKNVTPKMLQCNTRDKRLEIRDKILESRDEILESRDEILDIENEEKSINQSINQSSINDLLEVMPHLKIDCEISQDIDHKLLANKIAESDFLITLTSLQQLYKMYDKIITDKYKRYQTTVTPTASQKQKYSDCTDYDHLK